MRRRTTRASALAAPSRPTPATGWAKWVLVALVATLVLMPLARLAERGVSEGLDGYARMAQLPGIGATIRNTILLTIGAGAFAMVVGVVLAFCSHHCQGRLGRVLRPVPMLPLVIPAVASVIGWSFLLSPRVGYLNQLLRELPLLDHLREGPFDVYTIPWIIIITGLGLSSFVYVFVYSALQDIGDEYAEAARVSGAGPATTARRIVLPLLRPSLVYAGATVLLLGVGQFAAPLLLGRADGVDVLTTQIFKLTQDPPIDFALGAALGSPFLVLGLLIILLQRRALRDQARFRTHGTRRARGTDHPLAALILIGYALVAVALPLGALLLVALTPYWSGNVDLSQLTLMHVRTVLFDNPDTREAITVSILCAGIAALIVIPLGLLCASLTTSSSRDLQRAGRPLDVLAGIALVIPASLFGFAFLFAYTTAPFRLYGTMAVLIIAYVTLMIPHAMRTQAASLVALKPEYWAAARVAGASPLRAAVRIVVPLIRPGIGGGLALVFVMLSHEFAASMMLKSRDTQVMGTVLYDYWSAGTYPQVAAIALVMVVVTAVGVALSFAVGGSRAITRMES